MTIVMKHASILHIIDIIIVIIIWLSQIQTEDLDNNFDF